MPRPSRPLAWTVPAALALGLIAPLDAQPHPSDQAQAGQNVALTPPIPSGKPFLASRADEIDSERRDKTLRLAPPAPDKVERVFQRIEEDRLLRTLFGNYAGLGLRFGGLVTGSGFALGPAYSRPELSKENIQLRLSALGTLKQYYRLDMLVSVPRLFLHRLSLDFYGYRTDAPQMDYYGPGPDSRKTGRSNFRREDLAFDFRLGVRPHRRLFLGMTAGGQIVNVGPGKSRLYASADNTYTPRQTPGIDEQTDYGHVGPFLQVDFRDRPRDPHRGGSYVVRYVYFHDDELFRYSFRRLEANVEQYIPLLNEKRVIALRAQTDLSFPNASTRVPFYMQPTLGGSDDLRGYRNFRFYDNNRLVMNAEYRWEVIPALDMAVFADAGKVFHRPGQFSLARLQGSGGFGVRFKTRDAVVFRLDTGFSREGFQVWFKFGSPFQGLFHNLF